jgi:hypothetical protein
MGLSPPPGPLTRVSTDTFPNTSNSLVIMKVSTCKLQRRMRGEPRIRFSHALGEGLGKWMRRAVADS